MDWLIAIVLLGAGLLGGILVFGGKRDPLTKRYTPGIFRHPGSHFEANPRTGKTPAKRPQSD